MDFANSDYSSWLDEFLNDMGNIRVVTGGAFDWNGDVASGSAFGNKPNRGNKTETESTAPVTVAPVTVAPATTAPVVNTATITTPEAPNAAITTPSADAEEEAETVNDKKVKVKSSKKVTNKKFKITFSGKNVWKNVKVSVKDANGKTVNAKVVKTTKSYCVIKTTKKLNSKKYQIKLSGVKVKGASTYENITLVVK